MDSLALVILVLLSIASLGLWIRERGRIADSIRARRALEAQVDRLRADLEGARSRLEALVDSGEAALLLDEDGMVLLANPAARSLFGDLQEDERLMSYARSVEIEEMTQEALHLPEGQTVERQIQMDGKLYQVRAAHHESLVALWLADISELRRLSRARTDLIGNLSHELKTPLTSLRLLVDTMTGPARIDPELLGNLADKLNAEVDTLQQMTQEMLDLAAIESGRQVVRLVAVPLEAIARDPVRRLHEQAERKSVDISVDVDPSIAVLADPEQARRAVLNVLHNAIKFCPDGGQVHLSHRAEEQTGRVLLRVADNGPGLRPDELDRIFERFYRGDSARGNPGTGLGLSITRNIMQAHAGEVWAENQRPPASGAIITLAFVPA